MHRRNGRQPTIDAKGLTGDEGSLVGEQPCNGRRDLIRIAGSFSEVRIGIPLESLTLWSAHGVLRNFVDDDAGGNRVASDVAVGVRRSDVASERDQAGL